MICLPSAGRFKENWFIVITGEMKPTLEKHWEVDDEYGKNRAQR